MSSDSRTAAEPSLVPSAQADPFARFPDRFPINQSNGKPAVKWGQPGPYGIEIKDGEIYGLPTGPRNQVFVVDLDRKDGKDGVAFLETHRIEHGHPDLLPTLTVLTKSKGIHLYYRWNPDRPVRSRAGLIEKTSGIDVRGFGGYVNAGGPYEVVNPAEPADAPEWLLELVCTPNGGPAQASTPSDLRTISRDDPHWQTMINEVEHYAATEAPCISGQDGHNRLLGFTRRVRQVFGLPRDEARRILDLYNLRCEPPWSDGELEHKLDATDMLWDDEGRRVPFGWAGYTVPGSVFWLLRSPANASQNDPRNTPANDDGDPAKAPANDDGTLLEQLAADAAGLDEEDTFKLTELDLTADPGPLEWCVEGIFTRDSVNLLVAAPGSLKTWALFSLAIAIALGKPWLDRFRIPQCAKVLIIDWETGETRTRRRMRMLAKKETPRGIFHLRAPGNLQDPKLWTKIRTTVKQHGISVILYDSLAAGSFGADENSTEFAFPLNQAALIDDVTHIFIHHTGKSEQKKNAVARGSSAIGAAADTVYRFSDPEGSRATALTCQMLLAKADDGEQAERIPLRLTDAKGLEYDGEESAHTYVQDEHLSSAILSRLNSGPATATELVKSIRGRRQKVLQELKSLQEAGNVVQMNRKYQIDNEELRYSRVLLALANGHRKHGVLIQQASVTKDDLAGFVRKDWLIRNKDEFFPPHALPPGVRLLLNDKDTAAVLGIVSPPGAATG